MKRANYEYLMCDCCRASAPSVKDAKLGGWHVRDGVWMCDACFNGVPSSPPEDYAEDWIPDDGWC